MTELLQLHDKRRVIIDCWRLLQKEKLVNVADVVYLGQGNDEIEERVAKVVTA
jgi:hypothetical protein